ncbi:hypothetical protein JYU14_02260 [Simkania negevensis]|uniref:Uncharacterized protein n=1 Tax=Simkania negevensis TaxID=83561 RepID=A0ABS3ARF1_9BACT|nr:hypothetical protein [Simkania negevensis]
MKSERLRKLENELNDLNEWLRLGLVPKKDITKHKEEIGLIAGKIEEERKRLQFLREHGDPVEYGVPRKHGARTSYLETPTMPGVDSGNESTESIGLDTDAIGVEEGGSSDNADSDETTTDKEEDIEDPFMNPNRWRRGIIDPDSDEW